MESQLDVVQRSTEEDLGGMVALEEIFKHYAIPAKYRSAIIEEMVNAERVTVYAVMQALTRLANMEGVDTAAQEKLMSIGGNVALHHGETCDLGKTHFK